MAEPAEPVGKARKAVMRSVRAEAWVWEALEARAAEENRTVSELIRQALAQFVEPTEQRPVVELVATRATSVIVGEMDGGGRRVAARRVG